jgi:hypothetical protein
MAAPILPLIPGEPIFDIRPYTMEAYFIEGARADLEAEGIRPPIGEQWPERKSALYWEVSKLRYCLRRKRPPGLKGPMRLWIDGDWWCFRCQLHPKLQYDPGEQMRRIERRAMEEAARRCKALEDWPRRVEKLLAAADCTAFAAFKARVPGLVWPKRGRKQKAEA